MRKPSTDIEFTKSLTQLNKNNSLVSCPFENSCYLIKGIDK